MIINPLDELTRPKNRSRPL